MLLEEVSCKEMPSSVLDKEAGLLIVRMPEGVGACAGIDTRGPDSEREEILAREVPTGAVERGVVCMLLVLESAGAVSERGVPGMETLRFFAISGSVDCVSVSESEALAMLPDRSS
jgi:hypothetical protein